MTEPTRFTVSPPVPAITTHSDGSAPAPEANPHVAPAQADPAPEPDSEAKPARKGK